MDLHSLRLALEVARLGSFAAVARDRDVDPSSVSRAIAQVEAALGLRLFERTTRRLATTGAGEAYLARLAPVLEELDRARDEAAAVRRRPFGTLRLTASVAFGQIALAPLLADFRTAFPDLRLELILTDATLDLVGDRIDLAVRLGPRLVGDGIATKLFDTRYRVVASAGWLDAHGPLAAPADLASRSCVLFALPDFRSRWSFRPVGEPEGTVETVPVSGDLVISSALGVRDAALAGLGPALLADWMIAEDVAAGRLVDAFPGHAVTATDFETAAWLVHPSRAYLPQKTRVAIDFLQARLGGSAARRPQASGMMSSRSMV